MTTSQGVSPNLSIMYDKICAAPSTTNCSNEDRERAFLDSPSALAVTIMLTIMIVVTLGGNAITLIAIVSHRKRWLPAFYFLQSLCVADFMIGLMVIPLSIATHITYVLSGKWTLGIAVCDMFVFANFLFVISSIFSLCAVSWDRYVSVMSPLSYLTRMRRRNVSRIITLCWIGATFTSFWFSYFVKVSKKRPLCGVKNVDLAFSVTIAVIGYLVPFTFLIFVNGRILLIARTHLQHIKSQLRLSSVGPFSQVKDQTATQRKTWGRIRLEMRTTKLFLVVTGAFFFCYTPFAFSLLLDGIMGIPGISLYMTITLIYLNSACNPFLYAIFSKEIRSAVVAVLKRRIVGDKRIAISTTPV